LGQHADLFYVSDDSAFVPISRPSLGVDVELNVLDVIRSGRLAQGPMVERFEAQVSAMAQVPHAIAMSNGTCTLEAILWGLGIGPGDEVITSPFTFVATLNAIIACGATARFADITEDFTIDPAAIEALINDRTVAIMPIHLYGLCADMFAIQAIAARHGLAIIEDAAQAHGAEQRGRRAGSFGPASFSFYATKNISCGEGGAVTTSDDELARKLRLYRNQGMEQRYVYELAGRNLRMTELQAAIGVPSIRRLEEISTARAAIAHSYTSALVGQSRLTLPFEPDGYRHVWHQFTVLVANSDEREAFEAHLGAANIASGRYYPKVVYDYDAYRNHSLVTIDPCAKSESVASRCVSIPVHDQLTTIEVERVRDALTSFCAVRA
jgi:perosamine synthetase